MQHESTHQVQPRSSVSPWLIAGFFLTFALFAYVLIRWPDNFFADDSYFYFQVAWNIARGMGSTFNNVMPTNGYHPLWMLVCTLVFKLFPTKDSAIHGIGLAIAVVNAGALFVLARLLRKVAPEAWWAAFLLYMPFCFTTQLGTEGALSGLCLVCLMLTGYRLTSLPDWTSGILFTLSAALAVLSRLDNIFIVTFVYLAVFFLAPTETRSAVRRLQILLLPICIVLWGGYVTSNVVWFGTIQPISGMLKAHSEHHALFTNIPHVGQLAMLIILPCIVLEALGQRDNFFRCIEVPFTAGVLTHAIYISLVMSAETRWTWYYTSWSLLASVLLARCVARLLRTTSLARFAPALSAVTVLALLASWYMASYRRFGHYKPEQRGAEYQANIPGKGMQVVLAFDKPGRAAYYTTAQIIALDGLMGDLKFQHDLASRGIAAFDRENKVDSFMGPPQPLDRLHADAFCDKLYLTSLMFHCVQTGPEAWQITSVTVYARLGIVPAGTLELKPENMVTNIPNDVAVWKLETSAH
ncbi:hypothetical protein [Terriglobus tenax]|uniref:hypothetical protein n=1 Tax=Terriglobus tenax TaxID=1111115 RepID=UPI0021E00CBA|nr:hypothetical protein [Terriglobus tenax]